MRRFLIAGLLSVSAISPTLANQDANPRERQGPSVSMATIVCPTAGRVDDNTYTNCTLTKSSVTRKACEAAQTLASDPEAATAAGMKRLDSEVRTIFCERE